MITDYGVIEITTLWIMCMAFYLPLKKRKYGIFKAVGILVAELIAEYFLRFYMPWRGGALLAFPAVLAAVFFLICADISVPAALYCAVWSQLVQQLIQEAMIVQKQMLIATFGISETEIVLLAAALAVVCYLIVGATVARWMPIKGEYQVGPRQLSLAIMLQFIFILLYRMMTTGNTHSIGAFQAVILLAQFYCVTMLYLQYALFSRSAMRQELDIMNQLWYRQKEQYKMAKEHIKTMNRICHKLKVSLANMEGVSEKEMGDLSEWLELYDNLVKTGNEVLDTVLAEKRIMADEFGVRITCVADGKLLSCLDPVDVYSILSNSLENAIEAAKQFEEPEKRLVDMLICSDKGFIIIRFCNAVKEKLTFVDGLPVSKKPKNSSHGYSLKRMRHTVEKYDGFITACQKNGYYTLKILIPNGQQEGGGNE